MARRTRMPALLFAASVGLVACAALAATTPTHPDPAQTDGDKYHVLLENAQVRVLRYHDEPGESTHPHHHPCFVLYALGPFERELTFPDGSRKSRQFRAGETAWMPEQSHVGHNIGSTATDALLLELKGGCK
jgi:quercetin dioxygenase-like cupin family protein